MSSQREQQPSILIEQIRILKLNKKNVQDEIIERTRYRREQERLITETIENGNLQLRGLSFEIRDIEERRASVEADLYNLNLEKSNLIDEIGQLQNKIAELTIYVTFLENMRNIHFRL